ncbi:MAG: hypothetical protein QXL69_00965 [Candidatus Bathyarchaeia archaeon]
MDDKSKKMRLIHFAGGVSSDLIVELVVLNRDAKGEQLGFNIYDRLNDKLSIENFIVGPDDERYIPIDKPPWLVPDKIEDLTLNETELYNELIEFLKAHLDLLDDVEYHVLACFILASWRQEDFEAAPYLFFLGPMSSGKSRALECLQLLCYKAINAASITAPAVFRAIEAWHPTLLLDETEVLASDAAAEIRAVLNAGYRRETKAVRVEKANNNQPVLATFNVFCFKALAGTKELMNTLMSRCIPINMEKNTRDVNLFLDKEWAAKLRQKLLKYRIKNLGKNDLKENNVNEIKDGRLTELFYPLLVVAPEQIRENLIEYAKMLRNARVEEEKASIEAMVLEAIMEAVNNNPNNGKIITIEEITNNVNANLAVDEKLKNSQVGRITARLGFRKVKGERKRGIILEQMKLKRLLARYLPERLSEFLKTGGMADSADNINGDKVIPAQNNAENSIENVKNNLKGNEVCVENVVSPSILSARSAIPPVKKELKIYPLPDWEKESKTCMYCDQPASFRICGIEPWQIEYLCLKHKYEIEEEINQ